MATRCMAKVVWKVIGLNPGLLSAGATSHSGRASNIGDGLSWISRIRGGSIASVHLSVKGYGVFIVFAKRNKSHF